MRIWAKAFSQEKIKADFIYDSQPIMPNNFYNCIQEICNQMDIPTPIVTDVNARHFFNFNITKFAPQDFVESVDFDYFELECVPE